MKRPFGTFFGFRPSGQAMRIAYAIVALLCLPPIAAAQESAEPSEYDIKALYLLNFVSFTQWPDSAFPETDTPFVIGILGDDPFGNSLEQVIIDEQVDGRPIAIRHFTRIKKVKSYQLLFISASKARNLSRKLEKLEGLPILTISESKRFCASGGMINLVMANRKVAFEINVEAAAKVGLKPSGRLLSVAKKVHGKVRP